MRMIGIKRDRKKSFFIVAVALFLLCMVLSIASAQEQPSKVDITDSTVNVSTATPMKSTVNPWVVVAAGAFVLLAFALLIVLGYYTKEKGSFDRGEMRRAIAGTFVVGFTVLMVLCLIFNIQRNEVVIAYIELVGIIVGFYFGQRSVAAPKPKTEEEEIAEKAEDYLDELKSI